LHGEANPFKLLYYSIIVIAFTVQNCWTERNDRLYANG